MGRKHGAAVRLSRLDTEAVERGDLRDRDEAVARALAAPEGRAATQSGRQVEARDANERRLLDEVPPHFGKL